MPNTGDEFHHFGWNACSSALSPLTGHAFLERRYLIIPGIRSSRIYVIDVKEPLKAKIHKIIEPEEVFAKTGYSRPHTIHCGPEGIYVSTLGGGGEDGTDGPPGIFIMDCETFDILGRYEMDRGKQDKHYDFWWNLPRDYMVSSEWGLPPQFENGIVAEDLLSNKYGHKIHFWNLRERSATSRPSTSARTTRWRWKSGPRMTRPRITASAAWWWTPPTCRARSSPGGRRTTARSRRRRPSPSTRAPRRRRTCRRFCRASRPCRRWSPTSTSASMTSTSTSPAGGWARCISTMSPTR
jgi:hypothetical protein